MYFTSLRKTSLLHHCRGVILFSSVKNDSTGSTQWNVRNNINIFLKENHVCMHACSMYGLYVCSITTLTVNPCLYNFLNIKLVMAWMGKISLNLTNTKRLPTSTNCLLDKIHEWRISLQWEWLTLYWRIGRLYFPMLLSCKVLHSLPGSWAKLWSNLLYITGMDLFSRTGAL